MNRPGSDQDLVDVIRLRASTVDARIDRSADCWRWTGAYTRNGYGQLTLSAKQHGGVGTRTVRAHRAVWMLLRGAIPHGMELDHTCRTLGCVNPDHLEVVSPAENLRRVEYEPSGSIRPRPNSDGSVSYAVLFRDRSTGVMRQRSRTFPTEAEALAFRAQRKAG